MDFKPTEKDEKILGYICQNFSCKICNSIVIQCVTLSCGHQYCNYCLDMLVEGKSQQQCPQCSSPVKYAQPNDAIDQKIDKLIHSCSKPIHKAYTVALNARFQKSLERSKRKNDARLQQHENSLSNEDSPKLCNSFEDICKALLTDGGSGGGGNNDVGEQSICEVLKSSRKSARGNLSESLTPRTRREQQLAGPAKDAVRKRKESGKEQVDMDKVSSLFGIYDHLLQGDNEPEKEMAGGDFPREEDVVEQVPAIEEPLEGMTNFTRRSDIQLASLIKEADDIVKLDGHIQQWTQKMKDALGGNGDVQAEDPAENGLEQRHNVDDELWTSSNQLLRKLNGLQSQRKGISSSVYLPVLPPSPRSAKLDLEAISDDSDVEEYDEALNSLQACLSDLTPKPEETIPESTPESRTKSEEKTAMDHSQASGKRKILRDIVEEPELAYVKEIIQFITEMRKYKEALLKIQNREVETAKEIKELIPNRVGSFPPDNGDASTPATKSAPKPTQKSSKPPKNRIAHYSPMKAGTGLQPQQQHHQRPQHPFSARLPSIPARPRSATYDMSKSSPSRYQQQPPQQQQQRLANHNRVGTNNKLYSRKTSRRENNRAPMYTEG